VYSTNQLLPEEQYHQIILNFAALKYEIEYSSAATIGRSMYSYYCRIYFAATPRGI
jgi:hypothetical protein